MKDKVYTFETMGLKIEGTKERITELINYLCYGDSEPSHALSDMVSEVEETFKLTL